MAEYDKPKEIAVQVRMNNRKLLFYLFSLLLVSVWISACQGRSTPHPSLTALPSNTRILTAKPENTHTARPPSQTPTPRPRIKTPTATPTQSHTPEPPTSTPTITRTFTPTARWNVAVTEFVSTDRCGPHRDKDVFYAAWESDTEFTYGYYPYDYDNRSATKEEPMWKTYHIETGEEITTTPRIHYDDTFWERNQIDRPADRPELSGYFSPSGKYVIYSVWYGSVFDPVSSTEIWVAETHGTRKWKVYEFGHSNETITQAAWSDNETKVIFTTGYEGPIWFQMFEFKTAKRIDFGFQPVFSGVTEDIWSLSPDGHTLAVVDFWGPLLLVSLNTEKVVVVEKEGGNQPQWSMDGNYLFYWWRVTGKDMWQEIDELRAYNLATGEITTLVDSTSLSAGFAEYPGKCNYGNYYLSGNSFAVSPNRKTILYWNYWLYIISIK